VTAAINLLVAFQNEVQAMVTGGTLTLEQGQPLVNTAQTAIDQLSA
jgi:hypothetical protein